MKGINSKSEYINEFITFKDEETGIPDLTEKNARFFEAIVRLDSNYRRDFDPNQGPSEGYDPEVDYRDAKGKYCGSIAYWFRKMEENPDSYDRCLLGAIISIDSFNSTHLSASAKGEGRVEMWKRILEHYQNVEALKNALKEEFNSNKEDHILYRIADELEGRCNVSFASKFCSYASNCFDLKEKSQYSKYDKVVAENLPEFISLFLGEEKRGLKTRLNINNFKTIKEKMKVYQDYLEYIGKILDKVGNVIDREQFDHIVWYAFK